MSPLRLRWRGSAPAALLLGLLCGAGCHDTQLVGTALFLTVEFPPALQPTQLRFQLALGEEAPEAYTRPETAGGVLASGQTLRLLLPDEAGGRLAHLTVEGLREGRVVARAEGEAALRKGEEVRLRLGLSAVQDCPGGACPPVCDATSCPEGCCVEGVCHTFSADACGPKGGACSACPTGLADSCEAGACRCGNEAACAEGYRCEGGACVCDGEGCECASETDCTTPPGQCYAAQGSCEAGTCRYPFLSEGEECSDGDACTQEDRCNATGQCVAGAPLVCPPGEDACREAEAQCVEGACVYAPLTGVRECDGNACTGGDRCEADGSCTLGVPLDCRPPNLDCFEDTNTCEGGQCRFTQKPEGTPCRGGLQACQQETCNAAGQCVLSYVGAGQACADDGEECTRDICDGQGSCTHPNRPNGSDCGDWTSGCHYCSSGVCRFGCFGGGTCCMDGFGNYSCAQALQASQQPVCPEPQ